MKLTNCKTVKSQSGFTLLEIIIALTIVVVALLGIYGGLIKNVRTTAEIDERMMASWIAANAITEMRLESRKGTLTLQNDNVDMGGRNWRYKMTSLDASNPLIAKVDVQVYFESDNEPSSTFTAYMQRGE